MSQLQDCLFPLPDLSGKVAIVTGASRGIGKAIALRLAEAGCAVTIAAKSERSRELLPGSIHDTVEQIEAAGGRALAVRTDLRKEDDVKQMVAATLEKFGRIDLLVNNAGALWVQPVRQTPLKRFDLVHQVNARAPFLAAQLCLEAMVEQGGGHILNISPPLEVAMMKGKVGYCMSKFGQTLMSFGLADEVKADGVCVASLWPATIVESQASINHKMGGPEMWRKPEVVADAVLAWMAMPLEVGTGKAWLDEEVLATQGVTDLEPYNCVEGGQPFRIVGGAKWVTN
ncbi:MAG: SDR family oxidoreductase [Planctomycetes bacterium]|nr:SDR family oxidoreductase [Planctomycetota bacterium]